MDSRTLGCLGFGLMGSALVQGLIAKEMVKPSHVIAADKYTDFSKFKDLEIRTTRDNLEVVREADVILLAVKPHMIKTVADEVSKAAIQQGETNDPWQNKLLISMAAGVSLQTLATIFQSTHRIVRIMPNQPILVGAGSTMISCLDIVPQEDADLVNALFSATGKAWRLPEKLIDVYTGVAGSGPAYVFMFIEALTEAGVAGGLGWNDASEIAAQVVMGSARMVQETNMHPAQLRNNVCSPGGATMSGVVSLEENGFRTAVIEAVKATTEKCVEMGKADHN